MVAMPGEGSIKVLVVDDHASIRKGISSLINAEWPHMTCVGAAATAAEALSLTRECQPDVVLLDINLNGPGLDSRAARSCALRDRRGDKSLGSASWGTCEAARRTCLLAQDGACNRTGGRRLCGTSSP
jgi:CheY-like chemotaxis protein